MNICIFEDEKYRKLLPLAYFRPVYELRCGITLLKDKIIRSFSNPTVILHARDYLTDVLKRDYPNYYINEIPKGVNQVLFINGRVLADPHFADKFKYNEKDIAYVKGEELVAFWATGENLEKIKNKLGSVFSRSDLNEFEEVEIDAKLISYPWELVNNNGEQLLIDFNILTDGKAKKLGKVYDGVHLLNEHFIHIDEGTKVKPGVVLDAENGPIYIGKDVKILPNAVIEGPAYIGDGSLIKISAKIYENTSIGPVCKVGGEVDSSIIHAYSNKQHEGFIGHSYLGTWINIGADTNNSDLKNDYGNVKVYVDGELVDSGSMFVGLTMGDHSKSGINLMFNTGTVIGVSCNIYGAGLPPKFIPSFSWGGAEEGFRTYKINKAIEVAKKVMARRNVQFTEVDEKLFRKVFELTQGERESNNIKD